MDQNKASQTFKVIIFLNTVLSVFILCYLLSGLRGTNKINNNNNKYYYSDTTIIKEKPINKTITFNNTQPIKEVIIKESKVDTVAIITEFLKARFYTDSINNDTIKINWLAKVSKNSLDSLRINYTFFPKTKIITNIKETQSPGLGVFGAYNGRFMFGPSITYQNQNLLFNGGFDVLNKGVMFGVNYKIKNPFKK